MLADHTKWGVVGLCAIAGLEGAATLVTDSGLAQEGRTALADLVGELIIAGEEDEQPQVPAQNVHSRDDGRYANAPFPLRRFSLSRFSPGRFSHRTLSIGP